MELGDRYWAETEPVWEAVSIYDGGETFISQLRALTDVRRNLLSVHWCVSEVCNGGFHQFFGNPTGVLAPEAAIGFDEIGLPEAAAIVREAMNFFGPKYPREQIDRNTALDRMTGESRPEWDPFYLLDDRFYGIIGSRNHAFGTAADDLCKPTWATAAEGKRY